MIFSLIRGGFILLLAGALTYFLVYIESIPGSLSIEIRDKELKLSLLISVILLVSFGFLFWTALKTLGFFVAVSDFLLGKDTAILRFFKRIRYRKSQKALNNAVVALAEGENKRVLLETAKARFNPDFEKIVDLLEAQAEESLGHKEKADKIYKKLLSNKDTRLVAIEGLVRSRIESGDVSLALRLAEKAVLLKPKSINGLSTLFKLQCELENWSEARKTLITQQNLEKNTKDVRLRQEALILYADAFKKKSSGDNALALEKIREATRKSPSLVPAVCLASELEKAIGKIKNAEKLIKTCWRIEPHQDLAKSFASLFPDETPSDRLKRFKVLFNNLSNNEVVKVTKAELFVAAEDFPAARRILVKLIEKKPNSRILILMAAVEKGSGASEEVIQGWLSKAFAASRPPVWFCTSCNHIGNWQPFCPKCNSFDRYSWGFPETNKIFSESDALLPMLIGESKKNTSDLPDEEIIPDLEKSDKPVDYEKKEELDINKQ